MNLGQNKDRFKMVIRKPDGDPIVFPNNKSKECTIGRSMNSLYTIDSPLLSENHHLFRNRNGKTYLIVPTGIACELFNKEGDQYVKLEVLETLGLVEKESRGYLVPFLPGNRAILKIGDIAIGLGYVSETKERTTEPLPKELRRHPWDRSDYIFLMILFFSFLITFSSIYRIYRMNFPQLDMTEELKKRYAKLILELPIQMEEITQTIIEEKKEEEKKKEENKEEEKKDSKSTKKDVRNEGLLGNLQASGDVKKILDSRELKDVLQGVGVLTARRPAGSNAKGPYIPYRESANVDDLMAGISGLKAGLEGGSQKQTASVSNPFELSGSGAEHHLRSYDQIDKVIRKILPSIRYLYERYLRTDPNLKGRVTLRFVIAFDGQVIQCSKVSSNLYNQEFINDLIKRVKLLRFPPIEADAGNVSVVYPFTFIPKG